MDNVTDGFSLHDLGTGRTLHNFYTGCALNGMPKQVVFGEGGTLIIGGSENGTVHVFGKETGACLRVLRHSRRGPVRVITVRDLWVGDTHTAQARRTGRPVEDDVFHLCRIR